MTDKQPVSLDGRVAIVTGGGRGLGRSHALTLAAHGASVVVNDVGGALDGATTEDDPAHEVVEQIRRAGGEAIADGNSVATSEGGAAVVDAALSTFGRIDIVVNNAGILRDAAFHKMTGEQFDSVLDVHLRGAFHVTQPAWTHMRAQGFGRVINTTSNAGLLGNFGQANYAAAKMGLVGFTKVLALEGVHHDIKVNAIAPIAVTRMTALILGDMASLLDPGLVSPLVALLASTECPVSGEVLTVGAGRVARFFVGATRGWYGGAEAHSPQEILDRFDEIVDTGDFESYPTAEAELTALRALLNGATT